MKKLLSPVLFLAFCTAFMCGCSSTAYDWVVEINGKKTAPEEYIVAEMQAYVEAQLQRDILTDENALIDGIPAYQWIDMQTLQNIKSDYFVETEFRARGLEISKERQEYIEMFAGNAWDNVSGFYSSNGIGREYYQKYLTLLYKKQMVFNDIYMSGEKRQEIDAEVKAYLAENLSRISIFSIPKVNDDGSPLTEEQRQQISELTINALERLEQEDIYQVAGQTLTRAAELLGSEDDFSDGEEFVQTGYLSNISSTISPDIMQTILQIDPGVAGVLETEDCNYIIYKHELYRNEEEYLRLKQQVLSVLKDNEFNEYIKQRCDELQITVNEEAVKYYSPSKIVTKVTE